VDIDPRGGTNQQTKGGQKHVNGSSLKKLHAFPNVCAQRVDQKLHSQIPKSSKATAKADEESKLTSTFQTANARVDPSAPS
jgi:hypothetical protein